MTGPLVLETDGVSFSYGRSSVLSGVSLKLGAGANVLLGRNGAGKTTLIRVIAGAVPPGAGEVRLGGDRLWAGRRPSRRTLRRVGWLPQDFAYPPHMCTAEFIAYAAWLKNVPPGRVAARVDEVLVAADLAELAGRRLRQLSGGQIRRAGLAAALVADPDLLVLDEPTAGLDPEQRDGFHALIRKLRQDKIVLVATHLLEDVEAVAEQILVLDAGELRWSGTVCELCDLGDEPAGLKGLRQGFHAVLGAAR